MAAAVGDREEEYGLIVNRKAAIERNGDYTRYYRIHTIHALHTTDESGHSSTGLSTVVKMNAFR